MSDWFLGACQLLLVSMMWGATNPALNRASKEQEARETARRQDSTTTDTTDATTSGSPSILSLLTNYRFFLPFAVNQLGSVVFLHCLSHLAVSVAVPAVNALTMIITAATGYAMGEKQIINKRQRGQEQRRCTLERSLDDRVHRQHRGVAPHSLLAWLQHDFLPLSPGVLFGMCLMLSGICLCVLSPHWHEAEQDRLAAAALEDKTATLTDVHS